MSPLYKSKTGDKENEKNVSAQKETEKQGARIQKENVHEVGTERAQKTQKQGQKETFLLRTSTRTGKAAVQIL